MGHLKTLCGGSSKIWAGINNGNVKELSLSGHTHSQYALTFHTHSNYVTSSQITTIVKEAMDVVKLIKTESVSISNSTVTKNIGNADFVILRGITSGGTSNGFAIAPVEIRCVKNGSASVNVHKDYLTTLTIECNNTTLTITLGNKDSASITPVSMTLECYQYQ